MVQILKQKIDALNMSKKFQKKFDELFFVMKIKEVHFVFLTHTFRFYVMF